MEYHAERKYGWRSAKAPCSCDVVAPKVIEIIKGLGVSTVLDMGCGNGFLCGQLQHEGLVVTGAEYDRNGCDIARKAYPGIRFFNIGVYDSPGPIMKDLNNPFDCVISTEVIEHLISPQCLPSFASQVLRPSGYLVLSTPYHGFLKNLVLSLLNHWDAHHAPLWEGGHIKFWSRRTLFQLLDQNGFRVVKFYGVGRVPLLWKSMVMVAQKKEEVT